MQMRSVSTSRLGERRLAGIAPIGAGLCLAVVALAVNRGFDLGDEGWYLYEARDPLDFTRSTSGFQFFLHDLMRALNWSIPLSRLARLVLIVAIAGLFVRSIGRLLDRIGIPVSSSDRLVLAAIALVAPFGATWFPQLAGYNDLVLFGVLIVITSVIEASLALQRDRLAVAVPWALFGGIGAWITLMTKFTSMGAVVVATVAIPWALQVGTPAESSGRSMRRAWPRLLVPMLVGLAVGLLVWHVHYLPLGETLTGMRGGLADTANGNHKPLYVLWIAATDLIPLIGLGAIAVLIARIEDRQRRRVATVAWGLAVVLLLAIRLGSAGNITTTVAQSYVTPMVMLGAFYLAADGILGWWRHERSPSNRAAVILIGSLLALPPLMALGTNNSILAGAVKGVSFWLVAAFVLLRVFLADLPLRRAMFMSAGVLVVAVTGLAGTWVVPFNQPNLFFDGVQVDAGSPLHGLDLAPETAKSVDETLAALIARAPEGRLLLATGDVPGLVAATASRSPGMVYFADDATFTHQMLVRACATDQQIFLAQNVLVPSPKLAADFQNTCGVRFPDDFELLAEVPGPGSQVRVYELDPSRRTPRPNP